MQSNKSLKPTSCARRRAGRVAIEIREGDAAMRDHLKFLDASTARAAVHCEVLVKPHGRRLPVPIGALAEMRNGKLHLKSIVANSDGRKSCATRAHGTILKTSNDAAEALLNLGATKSWKPFTATV